MQNGSKSLFCGQPAPAGAQQCPAAKQQQGKQDVPPDAAGQREQKAVFLPDGTGKHIHMMHKEQPQAVPPQKAERRPQSVIGVQFTAQMAEDPKMKTKPQQVLAIIAEGKVGKYYSENCLLEQTFVKDGSMNVKQYVDSVAKAAGTTIDITGYVCFERGEGIEKKADNFAEEIASMIK